MTQGPRDRTALGGRVVLGVMAGLLAGACPSARFGARAADLEDVAACAPDVAARERVVAVAAGELRLAGGRVVLSPSLRLAAGEDLRDALGQMVEIRAASPPDRWGRLPAAAILAVDGDEVQWLEARAVGEGRAIVAVRPGTGCARALLAREGRARAAGLGVWADPANRPVSADDVAGLQALAGRFAIVEGRISAVGERHGTVYVNFGRRWTEDFTIRVAARDRRAFARDGLDLERMAGRAVRVRGHIELRGGPAVTATLPAQIEILEANR